MFAKDKANEQVKQANESFVNKLNNMIPNPRLRCTYMNSDGKRKSLGKPDYHLLMTNPDLEVEIYTYPSGRLCEETDDGKKTDPVIWTYNELAAKYGFKINAVDEDIASCIITEPGFA